MRVSSLSHPSDEVLLRDLNALVERDRSTTAALLAHLGEVDDRRLYAAAGFPSMFAYCTKRLRFSEDLAYNRIYVARAARRVPGILDAVARGRLHLTAARLLAPHLTEQTAEDLIDLAASLGRKSDIEMMLASRFPVSDGGAEGSGPEVAVDLFPVGATADERVLSGPPLVPEQVETMLELQNRSSEGETVSTEKAPSRIGSDPRALSDASPGPDVSARPIPAPGRRLGSSEPRFHLHLRLDRTTHEKLQYAQALLSHAVPSGGVELILDRALDALIPKLLRRRFGVSATPPRRPPSRSRASGRSSTATATGSRSNGGVGAAEGAGESRARTRARAIRARRSIPARIRSAVWKRDGGRCTYVGVRGHRCRSRRWLEFDHVLPVARGGTETIRGLRLRCRAHNQFEAERTFGRAFMRMKREAARRARQPIDAGANGDVREAMRSENVEAPAP